MEKIKIQSNKFESNEATPSSKEETTMPNDLPENQRNNDDTNQYSAEAHIPAQDAFHRELLQKFDTHNEMLKLILDQLKVLTQRQNGKHFDVNKVL